MGAHENRQTARDGHAAFTKGDADGAIRSIDDSIDWTVPGDNALSGVHTGKQQVGKLSAEHMGKNVTTEPHDFIADGDKVVVLTTVELEGEHPERRRLDLRRRRHAGGVRHARRRSRAQPMHDRPSQRRPVLPSPLCRRRESPRD